METKTKSKPSKKTAKKRQGYNFFKGQNKAFDGDKLAKDILARREKEQLSFNTIADETGIPASVIYRAETGENISVNVLASLCNWLSVPVQTYFK